MTTEVRDSLEDEKNIIEDIELDLLLEAIFRYYGFDFRNYAKSSIKRRVWNRIQAENLQTISGLQEKVFHDPSCMKRLLSSLSINVTSMFRDPEFFLSFRTNIIPILRKIPFIRIWHAGCSTGEEVYSMAILLHEEGLYEKTRIYATDMNEGVIYKAKQGIYSSEKLDEYTDNYRNGGGLKDFSDYYSLENDNVVFYPFLKNNIIFAQHNLVTDRSFNEFHVILCRNVMIYFDKVLQKHVHQLFLDSLFTEGVLALGSKETMRFTGYERNYEQVDSSQKIYRKVN
jgi:chemotaxis protein methyltransferase CheR